MLRYAKPQIDTEFFRRRSYLLNRLRDNVITESEQFELTCSKQLLDNYIFDMKSNRKLARGGKMTTDDSK